MNNNVKSQITVGDKLFWMDAEHGFGLINFHGDWTLIKFTAPLETLPPQGRGTILGQNFNLEVRSGQLYYNNERVSLEVK
jgi:hypothetical protein